MRWIFQQTQASAKQKKETERSRTRHPCEDAITTREGGEGTGYSAGFDGLYSTAELVYELFLSIRTKVIQNP